MERLTISLKTEAEFFEICALIRGLLRDSGHIHRVIEIAIPEGCSGVRNFKGSHDRRYSALNKRNSGAAKVFRVSQ
jgi:hypothetical protein